MTPIQQQLLACLSAYRAGRPQADLLPAMQETDWPALRELAAIHKLDAVVFETLRETPGFCGGDDRLAAQWRQETRMEVMGQAVRSQRIIGVSGLLTAHGVRHALVKGLLCRELYAKPDLRPSGDEDLYIDPADRERCTRLLEKNGFSLMPELGGQAVSHWQDPATGLHIELHTRLFDLGLAADETMERCFRACLDHTVPAAVTGGSVQTLDPTYHFAFLVCHARKHFLAGGVGIRTLCDVVTFYAQHRRAICLKTALDLVGRDGGRIFLDQLFAIGARWLALAPETVDWPYVCTPDPEELLLDSLEAGVYGQSSMTRRHSAGLVLDAARTGGTAPKLRTALFPGRESLRGRYPVLDRHPAALPFCWLCRLGRYGLEVLRSRGGSSPAGSVELGRKRTEMMVKYGVFPQSKTKDR